MRPWVDNTNKKLLIFVLLEELALQYLFLDIVVEIRLLGGLKGTEKKSERTMELK